MQTSFKLIACLLIGTFFFSQCDGQRPGPALAIKETSGPIGGPFENSEYGLIGRPQTLTSRDTTPAWFGTGGKLLIEGTVYKIDGKTPVPEVVLYYYHTDSAGYYSPGPNLPDEVARHGHLRGWVKTDADGRYAIHTRRPGAYPNRNEPAHIHLSAYEPGIPNPYYLDELVFDDDRLLTSAKRRAMNNRGGSGVLRLRTENGIRVARHNVILGLNIPHHPADGQADAGPGPAIGEDLTSFTPYHVWGPDAGTKACPICMYGKGTGGLFFVGPEYDDSALEDWLLFFESLAREEPEFRVFLVFAGGGHRRKSLERLGRKLLLANVSLTIVPSFSDEASEINRYAFDRSAGNLLLIYRGSNVVGKFWDLSPSSDNFIDSSWQDTTPYVDPETYDVRYTFVTRDKFAVKVGRWLHRNEEGDTIRIEEYPKLD